MFRETETLLQRLTIGFPNAIPRQADSFSLKCDIYLRNLAFAIKF